MYTTPVHDECSIVLESQSKWIMDLEKGEVCYASWAMGFYVRSIAVSGRVVMKHHHDIFYARCDMCGEVKRLHPAGDFDICDDCEKTFHQEEEE